VATDTSSKSEHTAAQGHDGLEREVASLRQELAESRAREAALKSELMLFKRGLDALSDAVNIRGPKYNNIYANPVALSWMRVNRVEEIEEASLGWLYLTEDEESVLPREEVPTRLAFTGERGPGPHSISVLHVDQHTGTRRWIHGTASRINDDDGDIVGVINVVRDITQQRANERSLARRTEQLRESDGEKSRLIERLEAMVRELSAPALEVWSGVLVIPIIGAIDTARGDVLIDTTLHAVQHRSARVVLIDLTAARIDKPSSLGSIERLTQGLALLGARCVLVGISPTLARFLVEHDLQPTRVETSRNLHSALRRIIRDGLRSENVAPKKPHA